MPPLLPLPLEHPVRLFSQALGGGAVPLRVLGGQLLTHRGGEPGVGQRQHRAGGPPQGQAQPVLAAGELQPEHIPRLSEVGGPAAGIGRGVLGQQQESGLSGPAGGSHRLLANFQPARPLCQSQQV